MGRAIIGKVSINIIITGVNVGVRAWPLLLGCRVELFMLAISMYLLNVGR